MKKLVYLFLFLGCLLTVQAATYYKGTLPLIKWIDKLDETNSPLAEPNWPWKNGGVSVLNFAPDDYANWQFYQAADELGVTIADNIPSDGSQITAWGVCNCGSFALLGGVDWTNRDYRQKSGNDNNIELEHVAEAASDLSFLSFLKLSGNRFRNIAIDGKNEMIRLFEIDLSNNPTLESLRINGVPNLEKLNVKNCGLLFSTLTSLADLSITDFTYAPQGLISRSFPVFNVDFSAELAAGSLIFDWSITPETSNNGVFTFDESIIGQTITVKISNTAFPDLGNLLVSVNLTNGEDEDEIQHKISTAADLDNVRNHLDGDFVLLADIDLTDYIAENYPEEGWLPIGDGTTKFTGTFNGNGHVISGLWINRPQTPFIGLFGAVGDYRYLDGGDNPGAYPPNVGLTAGATIKNLGIMAGTISGQYNVGTLAGVMGNAIVSGIYANATVIGTNAAGHGYNIGGLAGSFWGNNPQTLLQDCYTTGSVSGRKDAGGVLGSVFQNDAGLTINRIYSTCDVELLYGYYLSAVGGVIGKYHSPGGLIKINSSFAVNNKIIGEQATGSGRTGRFIGGTADSGIPPVFADSVYGLQTTQIRLYNFTGGDWDNLFYSVPQIVPNINAADATAEDRKARLKHGINKTAEQLIKQTTYAMGSAKAECNWDFSEMWTMGNDCYPLPVLKKLPAWAQPAEYPEHLKYELTLIASAGENGSISTHDNVRKGDEVIISLSPDEYYGVDEFTVNGEDKKPALVNNTYTFACIQEDAVIHATFKLTGGVYDIATAADLDNARNYPEGTFTLLADIDLTGYIAENYPEEGWLPIGTATEPFKGTFNGNGHVISGLKINRPDMDFVGLFGVVGNYRYIYNQNETVFTAPDAPLVSTAQGAVIKDLGIVGAITGKDHVGGLAGVMGNSIVTGVYVNATITGNSVGSNAGGIVGCFYGNNSATLLEDCYSTGAVAGCRYVGGIAGSVFQNDVAIRINRVYTTCKVEELTNYWLCETGGIIGGYWSPGGNVKVSSSFAVNETIKGAHSTGTGRFVGNWLGEDIGENIFGDKLFALNTLKYSDNFGGTYTAVTPEDNSKSLQRHGKNISAQELIQQSTYEDLNPNGWDFSETWTMGNSCYPLPILKKLTASAQPAEYPAHLKFSLSFTASTDGNGSISTHSVKKGDDVTVSVTPNANYEIDVFMVNGENKTSELFDNTYTFLCIQEDVVIHVTFRSLVGIPEIDASVDRQVYVNDNRQIVIVQTSEVQNSSVGIFNVMGEKLTEQVITKGTNVINYRLETGVYLVKTESQIKKVIVK